MGGRGLSSGLVLRGNRDVFVRSKSLTRALKLAENRIRHDPIETAIVLNSLDGTSVIDKSGSKSSVTFIAAEAVQMMDNVVTHNHPSGSPFSWQDLELAYACGVREMRACHSNGYYSLTRQFPLNATIPAKYADFAKDYDHDVRAYVTNTVNAVYARTQDSDKCNKMVNDYRRAWLKKNAYKYGWRYRDKGYGKKTN